jgi:hypothetical protein
MQLEFWQRMRRYPMRPAVDKPLLLKLPPRRVPHRRLVSRHPSQN